MRSIRGTLLWLILALVAVVLGIVSWFVYHDASHTLLTREAAMRELLVAGMVRQSAETRDYYDDQLLRRAQRIASRSQLLRGQPRYLMLGALATLAVPDGAVPSLAWLAQGVDSPISREVQRTSTIVVTEELLPRPDDVGTDHEFCAIWSEGGRLLQHSMTLEGHELILDPVMRQSLTLSEYFFEDARLPSGTPLRVVTLKAMVTGLRDSPGRLMFFRMPQQNTRPGPNAQRPVPTRQPIPNAASPPLFTFPSILVQYARETIECDARLAEIAQAFDRDVKELRRDTDATLAGLRLRLILTSLVAFILAAAGGTWLVHRSLVPVGRIADAVSRVSPTDFQLHIDRRDVPQELAAVIDKLQQTLTSLEQAFAHEKQAVADISHELRTPVASLLTTIQVCLRKPRGSEEYRATLQQCADIADHLAVLVQRLLLLARLDAGVDQPQRELVEVHELAGNCVDMLRPLAEAAGLTLSIESRPALSETDPIKLREIITNLVDNAIHYNRPGGRVDVLVAPTGGWVEIAVRDTGIGIGPQARQHLFERFFRADASRHSDTPRAGLGLAIVKGYLDLLGGSVDVTSEEGRGSTFRVRLPAATASAPVIALAG